MRRAISTLVIMLAMCGAAGAIECRARPLGETAQAFAATLQRRLAPLGVRSIDPVDQAHGRQQYAISGALFSLFLTEQDGLLQEISFVLSNPASAGEIEKVMTSVAWTLAHFSGAPEPAIKDKLYMDLRAHSTSAEASWNERYGSTIAVFARFGAGLVVKSAALDCE